MAQGHRAPKRYLQLTRREWARLGQSASLILFLVWVFWPEHVTFLTGTGLLLTVLIFGHMLMTAWRSVAFPGLVAFAACLQWVVAPWLAGFYPPTLAVFKMTMSVEDYLKYAIPATLALWLGLLIPTHRSLKHWNRSETQGTEPLTKRMRHVLDVTIVVALIVDTYGDSVPTSLAFLVYLVGSFRFFAAMGWMITNTPGWWIRVVLVLGHFAAGQAGGGVFYLVIQWAGYFLLVYAYIKRWRWQLAVAFAAGLLALGVLQEVKPVFRAALTDTVSVNPIDSVETLGSLMWDRVFLGRQAGSQGDFGDLLVRFNQGWIVARVMSYVPKTQPYANGDTLVDAAIFSIVPRFMVPSKHQGASGVLFMKYTGFDLQGDTRMGLGAIGELYANFGAFGGVVSTFVYGYLLGWLFSLFAARAAVNPLWWAAAAVVVLPGAEAGQNIEDIMNHVVKAGIVFLIVLKSVPVMSGLLSVNRAPTAGTSD